MRICRFNANRLGVIQGDQVFDVSGALAVLPASSYPLPGHDLLIALYDAQAVGVKSADAHVDCLVCFLQAAQ